MSFGLRMRCAEHASSHRASVHFVDSSVASRLVVKLDKPITFPIDDSNGRDRAKLRERILESVLVNRARKSSDKYCRRPLLVAIGPSVTVIETTWWLFRFTLQSFARWRAAALRIILVLLSVLSRPLGLRRSLEPTRFFGL